MSQIVDQRIVTLEIANEFTCGKTPLNEIIEDFYNTRIANEIKNKRSETKFILSALFRKLFEIDNIIDQLTDKNISPRNIMVRNCIRIAIIELIDLERPAYAVINSWVEIAKDKKRLMHFSKLINAILRKFLKNNTKSNLAISKKIPSWLWKSWSNTYGKTVANKIIEASLMEPPLDISYVDQENNFLQLQNTLPGSFRLKNPGKVNEIEGFKEGKWWVQDSGATIPVNILGDVNNREVLDLCSAPGGKAMQLLAKGANVTCIEISKKRVETMKKNFQRTKLKPEIICADILKWGSDKKYDFILLDAPCSATGTIRKNPDLIHIKDQDDLKKNIHLQKQLLQCAYNFLNVNGVLVYCVCSLEIEEGEDQIEAFLAENQAMSLMPIEGNAFPEYRNFIKPSGYLRTLPHLQVDGGIDGFFISKLYKKF
ncbi:RsmB/NOP family class I SAM-dependent RNA methyltransferase [bacterium]|nr:RsmB/NOP family class I SAM-dependent RNA methyltransferase [Pelagibacteraceae bacterium]MDC3130750.1 RsmB/NOP family class I SAM-dependent RNA methyltransferase [bacterium]